MGFWFTFSKITGFPPMWLFFKPRFIGKRPPIKKGEGVIIASNHHALVDVALLSMAYPTKWIHFPVAGRISNRNKFVGFILKEWGTIPVSNNGADIGVIDNMVKYVKEGKIVGIFPEGKLHVKGVDHPYRPGAVMTALKTGAKIIPIYNDGNYGLFKRTTAVSGEPVDIREYCSEGNASSADIPMLCSVLKKRVEELEEKIPQKYKRKE